MSGRETALLSAVADALNACEQAGIRVKLTHGAVFTSAGWVLPPVLNGQTWTAQLPSGAVTEPSRQGCFSEAGLED